MLGLRKRVGDLESRVSTLEEGQTEARARLIELVTLNERVLARMAQLGDKLDSLIEALDARAK